MFMAAVVLILVVPRHGGNRKAPPPQPASAKLGLQPAGELARVTERVIRPAAPCREQQIEITEDQRAETVCVSDTTSDQNGSVRTYRVDAADGTDRSLLIEAMGSTILSAALGGDSRPTYKCENNRCNGKIGRAHV